MLWTDSFHRLTALRALIHETVPHVNERIEWKMPVFGVEDRWLAAASQKSYISVYLGCEAHAAAVIAVDPALKGGKSCVNITDKAEMPFAALKTAISATLNGNGWQDPG